MGARHFSTILPLLPELIFGNHKEHEAEGLAQLSTVPIVIGSPVCKRAPTIKKKAVSLRQKKRCHRCAAVPLLTELIELESGHISTILPLLPELIFGNHKEQKAEGLRQLSTGQRPVYKRAPTIKKGCKP